MRASLRTRLVASVLRAWRLIRRNPLVDRDFYIRTYPDVARLGMDPALHYFRHGLIERRNPNAYFDTEWYLASNPDVAASGMNPLDHYLLFGAAEGRDPGPWFDSDGTCSTTPMSAAKTRYSTTCDAAYAMAGEPYPRARLL